MIKTFDEYNKESSKTAKFSISKFNMLEAFYVIAGLAGESGEVANQVKKIWRDDKGVLTPKRKKDLEKELGDVFWYLFQTCNVLGLDPKKVAQKNIDKLRRREENGTIKGDGDDR